MKRGRLALIWILLLVQGAYACDFASLPPNPEAPVTVLPSLAYDAFINPMGNFDAYRGAGTIVLLADGTSETPGRNVYLGYQVAGAVPEAHVVRADYNIKETRRMGNLEERHVNHREPLPFATASVDLLVMRRGLCTCHGPVCCGGIDTSTPETILPFLRESARVLNQRNPNAGVYFVNEGGDAQDIGKWQETLRLLLREEPGLRAEILTSATGLFNGIVLRPLASAPRPSAPSPD